MTNESIEPTTDPAQAGETEPIDATLPIDATVPIDATLPIDPAAGDPGPGLAAGGPHATGPTAATAITSEAEPDARGRVRSGPRVGTIVWGFIVAALGCAVLAAGFGAGVDLGLFSIAVLAVAGVTLVVGSIVAGLRRHGA